MSEETPIHDAMALQQMDFDPPCDLTVSIGGGQEQECRDPALWIVVWRKPCGHEAPIDVMCEPHLQALLQVLATETTPYCKECTSPAELDQILPLRP